MREIRVKMGEIELTTIPGIVLTTPGLGSGVGMGVYDRKSRMAGMAHIILPDSKILQDPEEDERPYKYADVAVSALLGKMLSLGAKKENLVVKIAGGIDAFNFKENSEIINIGGRNVKAVYNAINEMGLTVANADTGGSSGRILKLNALSGAFYLKIIGKKEAEF